MSTRRAALKEAVVRLRSVGVDTPVLDARLIVQHVLGLGWDALFLAPDQPLAPAERASLDAALDRRAAREPVARIVGRRHFWTLDLAVTDDTLDPRADTETLVEAALAEIPDRERPLRLLDLGTGTGALLLALLWDLKNSAGTGIDISPGAIAVAKTNAETNGLAGRATFTVGDWAAENWDENIAGPFDVIVSNPPYIPDAEIARLAPDVRDYDPHSALNGGADGLDAYRRIVPALPRLLAPGGFTVLEIGQGQGPDVTAIAKAAGLALSASRADLGKIERALVLRPEFR